MIVTLHRPFAAFLLGSVLLGCGGATGGGQPVGPAPMVAPAAALGGDPASIAKAKADSARYPYTAADIHFMTGMIGHHAQAIEMAGWAAQNGASDAVQRLADRIAHGQRDEIVIMQRWLRDRSLPVPAAIAAPMVMEMNGMQHSMLMPGMLTDAQMHELQSARGRAFDERFLRFMLQHHRGAVTMVAELFATDGAGQDEVVFKFASDVNVDQATEIARMERMLVTVLIEARAP